MKRRVTPAVVLVAAATALSAGLSVMPASASTPGSSNPRSAVDAIPLWATPAADAGPMAAGATIDARVYLASRDPAGLDAFVAAVSDPSSSQYQQYLSPEEATARFGSRDGAADRVASWLRSVGLTVTGSNSHYVAFRGSPAAVGAAFQTAFDNFSVGGKSVFAATRTVTIPAGLAADVLTVTGLSSQLVENRPLHISDDASSDPATATPEAKAFPCSAYEGEKMATKYPKAYGETQPYAICGYEPKQLRGAYGVADTKWTGKGITTVVVDAYALPTMAKDLDKWTKARGEQAFKKGQYKEYVPDGTGYNPGWAGEEALDIEAIHAMAPDANINYVAAINAGDTAFLDAFDLINDKKLGDAVNNSWGGGTDGQTNPAIITAYEQRFKMGATEGIGYYFSSGDSGGAAGTMYPAADPYVTAVGGTAIGIDKKNGYMYETGWETDYASLAKSGKEWTPKPPGDFASGAGGGTTTKFAQPKWQKGVVSDKFSEAHGGAPMRTIPDISAVGDPTTGFLEGYSSQDGGKWVYGELRIGGTSLSSPLIVGMQAIAEQAAGGKAFGFANPAIYKLFGSKSYNDVTDTPYGKGKMIAHVRTRTVGTDTVVSLATAGQSKDGGLLTIKGWDTVTGVGSPTASYYKSYADLR
jgi:subtilase family serine protease